MNDKKNELAAALMDVRRAYRLLHAYHRRLQDLFQCLDDVLVPKGIHFKHWRSSNVDRLPKKSKPFFRNWAWDLTPAYQMSCVWEGVNRKHTYSIGIDAIADTGYNASGDGEPDPSRFKSADHCGSELQIGFWRTTAKEPDWGAAWTQIEKRDWSNGDIHAATVVRAEYLYRYETVNLVDLVDEHAVREKLLEPLRVWIAGA
jgi:hypothetical protein